MPEKSAPFGPHTIAIEWDIGWIEDVQRAINKGTRTMAGVSLTVLHRSAPVDSGGVWVAISLPRALFLDLIGRYADEADRHSITHVVQEFLFNLGWENGERWRTH